MASIRYFAYYLLGIPIIILVLNIVEPWRGTPEASPHDATGPLRVVPRARAPAEGRECDVVFIWEATAGRLGWLGGCEAIQKVRLPVAEQKK